MAKETVIIGCKLPAGITLEVGLQTTEIVNGNEQTAVKRLPNYQKIVLRGWHAHNATGLRMPAGMDMRPYLNRNVDAAAWAEWKRTHPNSWLLKNEILFEAKDEPSAAIRVAEGEKTPTLFKPIDPANPMAGIKKADFADERN